MICVGLKVQDVDNEARQRVVEYHSSGDSPAAIGTAIGEALLMVRDRRVCQVAAVLVLRLQEEFARKQHEFWPGYQESLDDLLDAAQRIHVGWQDFDARLKGAAP